MKSYVNMPSKSAIALGIACLLLMTHMTLRIAKAADNQPLEALVTKASDIKTHRPNADILLQTSGATEMSSAFHPLNRLSVEATIKDPATVAHLLNYREAYQTLNVVSELNETQVVASFAYRYDDSNSASAAVVRLTEQLAQTPGARVSQIHAGGPISRVAGQTSLIRFVGREGTLISWSIATRGRSVILIMVEGRDVLSTRSIGDLLTEALPTN